MRKLVPVVALAAALVAAAPAAAHVGVKSYSPKRGATVDRPLTRVKVTFKGAITDGHLTVRGLGRGRFSVSMEVLHTDGHVMRKSWSFNLK